MSTLPYAYGGPPLQASLRSTPEDFIVDELQSIAPDGDGDHAWLLVRKRGANTDWVAKELARFAGVNPVDVGYAGLKDRDAVTTQVFTVHLPGRPDPDWSAFPHEGVEVLEQHRHRRKLKRGALLGNRFTLHLRNVQGDTAAAEQRLQAIATRGVPNYFGDQRFGLGGANVARAEAMFAGKRVDRNTRSMLLSAVRSQLFNLVLAERVRQHNWDQALDGEVWSLSGSRSWFGPEAYSEALAERLASGDIHPSGPLWGRGSLPTTGVALELEQHALQECDALKSGLERAGLDQDRRALRLFSQNLQWQWPEPDVLKVQFQLPPGTYATVLMRELAAG
ncbi:tRNA pseudouridine(13) synthase TruD [Sinimarinibacterium sp. CAU 1509]|uniref:tRNA pseudouridine(13) synthase TruD n=1 Tax=Sinimarinibacterium sp. CAU 1509 TaxID=2562283 RepID=UPI0010AD12F7|nr:tRNA pseudouridine(13) synthase TruD [Sinimarinibacterium sp. CAU 1509]TJY55938.1 tRNA pseudouridine(13) synthase TruD [Sinimarinibacterium sp. CAU 1509]